MERTKIVLKSGKDQSARRFHPWIFSGAIKKMYGNALEGDLVDVYDNKDELLGTGHYSPGSIAVRIITFDGEEIDETFWKSRFQNAYALRQNIGLVNNKETNLYRLIHAEGDNMPGLIIDVYGKTAVIQCHSIGMWENRMLFANILKEIYGDDLNAVYDKSAESLPKKNTTGAVSSYLLGSDSDPVAMEYGLKFHVDWLHGQKTGFFIDQRENRSLLEFYSKERNVLNMFCYTGGFSFYAMRGGAKVVHSVDSSARAIDITNQNVEFNFPDDPRHEAYAVDAFKFMDDIKDKYDLIVLDPPAFAKHRNVLSNAVQGYKRLNVKALHNIKKGGILFTYSCSQVVSADLFRKTVFTAAAISRRKVRILHQMTQPADHPINIYHPESEYLKGLVLMVD